MVERKHRGDEFEAKLGEIERELRALRGAVSDQTRSFDQVQASLGTIQAQIAALGNRKKKPPAMKRPEFLKKLGEIYEAAYVKCARVLLRANVEELFDRDYYREKIPRLAGSGENPVYHYLTTKGGISPHWLFDRQYYLATYPDVVNAGVEPLVHFLRSGWREGRNPHPLFNTRYYLSQAPGLLNGKMNPVRHYLLNGWKQNLKPHPLMDGGYYLENQPDVRSSGMDPLSHYTLFGAFEGRKPTPWFDPGYYRSCYPDVLNARIEPLQHYLLHGAEEERTPHPVFDPIFYVDEYGPFADGVSPLEHFVQTGQQQNFRSTQSDCVERFLPAKPAPRLLPRGRKIDIVVPVYRGLAETRACIASVLGSSNREQWELVVIDDCSPEPELTQWLEKAAAGGAFTLLRNAGNLGFVATVNRGMFLHADRDVVLLNSDTVVANDWLDRLERCAYATAKTGTVTPFSNNATICSYPKFCEDNALPPGCSVGDLDRLAAAVNQGRWVSVPTAVGFCMYIRRDCLRETGLFDVESFGLGYGEENDFCLRASSVGWQNVMAADVFVYHAGSVSFAATAGRRRAKASRTLLERHPSYDRLVARFVSRDPAQPYRFALTAGRYRTSGKPVVLLVTHGLGGGVGQHVEDLAATNRESVHFLELQPLDGTVILLRCPLPDDGISIRLDYSRQYDVLVQMLRSCGISHIHVHHVLRHTLSIEGLSKDLGVPIVFTVHDYYSICPRIVLADPDGRYCGEPDEAGCNRCIRETLPHITLDIASWRAKNAWLIQSAREVIAPSRDVAVRISRYYPEAAIEAAAHPQQIDPAEQPAVKPAAIDSEGVLKVVVLGVMSYHKGLFLLEECAQIARDRELPLEFVLAGYCEPQVQHHGPFTFRETGAYARENLLSVLEGIEPGLIWFPVRLPETFSYTLSSCLEWGFPIVAPRLGSFPERLKDRNWTVVYDWDSKAEELTQLFLEFRQSMITGQEMAMAKPGFSRELAEQHFYPEGYVTALKRRPAVADLREKGRLSVMAMLSSYESGQIQSCGYIRSYLPLTHSEMVDSVKLTVISAATALTLKTDVLLIQRTTVADIEEGRALIRHCERESIRIIYETDDDLFHMDASHEENSYYAARIAAAELIARHASLVLVSTKYLKHQVAHLNKDVRVVSNALDEGVWFGGSHDKSSGKKAARAGSEPVRILYMGTMTHSQDLDLLEEPFRILKAEFGEALQFEIIGITADGRDRNWLHTIPVPGICGHSYPLFAEWIRGENRWSFGVAPLVDNPFNRSKSYIKYLDYGALGLAGIYPKIGVFEDVVRDGETGLLVEDPEAWYDAMRLLITDHKLRQKMGEAAYLDVLSNHTIATQANQLRKLWTQAGSLPPVRSKITMVSFSEETAAISSKGI
jgi:GT2 family glycosyltransferase/glycosyltransferase involved in cell wall biosynthesis